MDLINRLPGANQGFDVLLKTALNGKDADLRGHGDSDSVRGGLNEVLRLLWEMGLVEWGGEEFAD